MRLTERTEIAIRIIKVLFEKTGVRFSQLKDALEQDDIHCHDDAIRNIICSMMDKGYVVSMRGRGGGYSFLGPDNITAWDIVQCVETPLGLTGPYLNTILRRSLSTVFIKDLVDTSAVYYPPLAVCSGAACQSL
jgi:DNA-binding IscR family transcriptional regulator